MNTRLYTNTGKMSSIVGLVITTLAVSYVAQNSTQIVNEGLKLGKKLINTAVTKQVSVWSTAPSGQVYDTGMKVRVSRFQKLNAK